MKKIWIVLITIATLTSCNNPQKVSAKDSMPESQKDYIEVIYFHGKQRCITCNAIENLTKEVLETNFSPQLKEAKIVFKVVDISTKEGEKIADKYEVTWSSLFINKWKDGKETKNNMTEFAFSYAKGSPDVFKAGVKEKINKLLK